MLGDLLAVIVLELGEALLEPGRDRGVDRERIHRSRGVSASTIPTTNSLPVASATRSDTVTSGRQPRIGQLDVDPAPIQATDRAKQRTQTQTQEPVGVAGCVLSLQGSQPPALRRDSPRAISPNGSP